METVTRNVRDLAAHERSTVEQLVGHGLSDQQQLIIQVVGIELATGSDTPVSGELPDWCNIYEGMSDDEIAEVEKSIVRSDLSRSFE